jgi:RNA polymerase sigma-70 factor (ECF subfamily)
MDQTAVPKTTDEELVESYQRSRQRQHLEILFRRHLGRVRGMIYGMVLNQSDADDLTQEVCLRAIRGLPEFNARAKFSTWLYRVAINTTHRFLQRQARSPLKGATRLVERADPRGRQPEQEAIRTELKREISEGLAALSPSLRAAMVLMVLEGVSANEAAEIEDCSPATMYWRVHEARKILMQRLARYLSP